MMELAYKYDNVAYDKYELTIYYMSDNDTYNVGFICGVNETKWTTFGGHMHFPGVYESFEDAYDFLAQELDGKTKAQ